MKEISRLMVIEQGIHYLQDMGADHVCRVCIANGGSCCTGCRHLQNGVGCQLRNTSCTAWLCGFLKYVLYEMGLLQEWNDFWDQVPGQGFREDFTPELLTIHKPLINHHIEALTLALATDLDELARRHIGINFIALRERIDKNISLIYLQKHPNKRTKYIRKIQLLTIPFRHFKATLAYYKERGFTDA